MTTETLQRYRGAGTLGESPALQAAIALAERASRSDEPILLEGESGTGKELFARAIHRHGARSAGPFLALNFAAVPEPVLGSELFGHVRGAFGGAAGDRCGLFEAANGGTLFLDAEVVRVLEEHSWPGNVRELENLVQFLIICSDPVEAIGLGMLPGYLGGPSDADDDAARRLEDMVRDVRRLLARLGRRRDD